VSFVSGRVVSCCVFDSSLQTSSSWHLSLISFLPSSIFVSFLVGSVKKNTRSISFVLLRFSAIPVVLVVPSGFFCDFLCRRLAPQRHYFGLCCVCQFAYTFHNLSSPSSTPPSSPVTLISNPTATINDKSEILLPKLDLLAASAATTM
jgi:hypothetical protein